MESGNTATLYGARARVEAQHGPLLVTHLFLVVRRHEKRHRRARRARGRLDDVGHVALARRLIEVLELLAGVLRVLGEVVVAAVGDALELVPSPREEELDVARARRVVRQLIGIMGTQPKLDSGMPSSVYQP